MRKDTKRLAMTAIVFVSVIAGVLLVNRWIIREINDVAMNVPSPGSQTVDKTQLAGPLARPVTIDPANDPLAPVIPRKDRKSTAKKATPRQTNPQKIYEPAEASVILVQ